MTDLRQGRARQASGAAAAVARALLLWLGWQVVMSPFIVMPPPVATVWLLGVVALFLWCYAGGWSTRRGRAKVRLRPLGRATRWLIPMAPTMSVLALSMWVFLRATGLAGDTPLPKQLEEFAEKPGGVLALLVLVVIVAPLTEEFAFRGWMQRPLERRLGARAAIALTAVLFALAHLQPDGIPIRLAGGVALGWVVWATGSIWAGVALHVAWNVGVMAFSGAFQGWDPGGRGAVLAIPAALVFAGAAAVFAWAGRRMRAELRAGAAAGAAAPA